jgi:small subunit ribosomal protein S1
MEQEITEEVLSNEDIQDIETLNQLYEESLNRVREGDVVKGEIVDFDKDAVVIDIGYKSTGQIPLSEFSESEDRLELHVGDELDVLLLQREDKNGCPILSKKKAEKLKTRKHIEDVYHKNGTLKGKIISEVKGGFQVDVGLWAFLPASQVDLKPIRDKKSWIGTDHEFKILKYNRQKRNIVLSRRKYLEEAWKRKVRELFSEGEVYSGTVSAIVDFGLFVNLGGIEGLVHKSNLSWGRVDHPSRRYQIGEKVTVKVLGIDEDKLRISLGIKQLEPNPWETIADRYPIGAVLEGKVVGIQDFGIFIGIDDGIDGLVHISDISWTKTVHHPGEIFKKGQIIRAVVLKIDQENERFSLGIKQLIPNPWEHIPERYRPGTHTIGKIVRISEMGLIIQMEEAVDGVVPHFRLPKPENITEFNAGELVQVKVISVSKRAKKIELTIPKQKDDHEPKDNNTYYEDFARELEEAMMT